MILQVARGKLLQKADVAVRDSSDPALHLHYSSVQPTMGACLSIAAAMDSGTQQQIQDLQSQIQQRDQQLLALGSKPAAPLQQAPQATANGFVEVLFFPDPAMPCR